MIWDMLNLIKTVCDLDLMGMDWDGVESVDRLRCFGTYRDVLGSYGRMRSSQIV